MVEVAPRTGFSSRIIVAMHFNGTPLVGGYATADGFWGVGEVAGFWASILRMVSWCV